MARPFLLAMLAVLLLPGMASAAQPVLGLTTDGRIVRFDAAAPGTIERALSLGGLRDGDTARALSAGRDGLPWVLGAQGRFYRLDPWTGQLMKPIDTMEFWKPMNPAPPSDRPFFMAMQSWSATQAFVATANLDLWRTDTISAHTEGDRFPMPPNPPVAPELGAITAPTGSPPGTRFFGIDVANDTLLTERYYDSLASPLGVDARAPAGLATLSADQALLASTAATGDRSEVHLVNLATGATTPVGATPAGVQLVSLMRVDPPTFSFESPTHFFTPGVHEGAPENTSVRVVRNGDPAIAASVRVGLGGDGNHGNLGPAQPGEDYDPTPTTIHFAPGQRTADVPVTFFDDDVPEVMEDVGVQLEPGPGSRVSGVGYAFVIHDDDTQVVEREYAIWENEGGLNLPIIRPPAGFLGLSVPAQVTAGTAVRGDDFTIASPDVGFRPHQGRGELPVGLADDTAAEGDETVVITFGASPRHRVTGVARTVQVTIRDNDRAVAVRQSSLTAARRHRLGRALRVKLDCPQACGGTLDLVLDRKRARRARTTTRLTRRVLKQSGAQTRTATLRLSNRATRRLRRVAPVRASLRLRLRLGTAPPTTLRRTVTLVR